MRLVTISGLLGLALVAPACGGARPAAPAAGGPGGRAVSCERQHPEVAARPVSLARQGATVALARVGDRNLAYVADEDADVLRIMDVDAGVERALTVLSGSPAQVVVLGDGRVAVTLRDKNRVEILEPTGRDDVPLESRCSAAVAVEPIGIAATPDDRHLLVTSAFGRKLTALDTATLKASFDVDVAREPRAVVVDDDGQRAFVAHVVGARMSVVDLATDKHDVREIDLRVKKLGDGKVRGGCQGFALAKSLGEDPPAAAQAKSVSADDAAPRAKGGLMPPGPEQPAVAGKAQKPARARGRVFAPMVTVDPGEATVRSGGYGTPADTVTAEMAMVSVVDGAAERTMTRQLLTDGVRHQGECILPRAAAVSPADGSLFVTCFGTDSLVQMDGRGLDPARLELHRWPAPSGPSGVALDPDHQRAVVWGQFDHELAIYDLSAPERPTVRVLASPRSGSRMTVELAWGRRLFHRTDDPAVSSDGRACASCHPDGREDALTWSTPDGPRQTIMLSGRTAATAPYGWGGANEDLKSHLHQTFRRLGGTGLADAPDRFDELDALVAYIGHGLPAPERDGAAVDPRKAALAARGQAIFDDTAQGCATCHLDDRGTDHDAHDVGSAVSADVVRRFDTPSLRFVGGTAPYFHDGRYATLEDLLRGSDGRMGHTLQLAQKDVVALKAYLETL